MSEQNPIPVVPDVGMPIEEGVKALVALTPRKEAAMELRAWCEKWASVLVEMDVMDMDGIHDAINGLDQ